MTPWAPAAYLLKVLELKKLFSSMACHVDEDVAPLVCQQPLGSWHGLMVATFSPPPSESAAQHEPFHWRATCEDTNEVLDRYLVASVINFDL